MVSVTIGVTGDITAATDHYQLRSPVIKDAQILFDKIFNDPQVMERYAAGQLESFDHVLEKRVKKAFLRSMGMDPWHMLMVFEKNKPETAETFIGFVVAGHGEENPQEYGLKADDPRRFSELAIAIAADKQKKGAGTELIGAITEIAKKALGYAKEQNLPKLQFDTLIATMDPDHPARSIFKLFDQELIHQKTFTDKKTQQTVVKRRVILTSPL